MRRISASLLTIIAIVLVVNVVCLAQPQSLLTRHVRQATVTGEAKLVGQLPAKQTMRLVVVLPLSHRTELQNFLEQLRDPAGPFFQKFLTVEEFTARYGPSQENFDAVIAYAKAHGLTVTDTTRNRMNVYVTGTVRDIENAFHVTLGLYQHPTENRSFYAPDREPSVDLPFQLWHVSGLDNYSIPRPMLKRRSASSNLKKSPLATTGSCPGASFCGSDMRAAYYGGSLTGTGQTVGLLEYYGTDLADLSTYYKNAGQTEPFVPDIISTDGSSTTCLESSGCDDTEQTLDMTQAMGMAPGMSQLYMYVGSVDTAIFGKMVAPPSGVPLSYQLSSSWTWSPADPSTDDPYFEEMESQGQNIFQASGDSGSWQSAATGWPSDSEYVISTGGTDLTTKSAGGAWSSESAWVDGGGGVGTDDRPIPTWQTDYINFSTCSSCSKTYRNGPDISANANFTYYVCADQTTCTENEYGGTSFAAPLWAGYLALVNEQRATNGLSPLTYFNPLIYPLAAGSGYSTDFHDITSGSNGHSATAGYDLATGWGSPNGAGLLNALAGTTTSGFSLSASPSSISIADGGTGSVTITSSVTGGFDGTITLSASGEPSGVTVAFSPTSITGAGSSTMTFTVGSSVAAGTYTITVTGTSGSTTETTTVSLTVTSTSSGFSISASPTSISIAQGSSGTVTITSTVTGGFDGVITLSASGEGSAQTITFSPTTITGAGTSTMTIKVGKSARTGDHTITVKGASGSTSHTATVTLDVLK